MKTKKAIKRPNKKTTILNSTLMYTYLSHYSRCDIQFEC